MTAFDQTELSEDDTGGLGRVSLRHPPGTFTPSPASRTAIRSIGTHQDRLSGLGIDWGCGVGSLAVTAALIPTVDLVVGLDLNPMNIEAARENAVLNGVGDKTSFFVADSVRPKTSEGQRVMENLRGSLSFVLTNPPASSGDDGLGFRREVLSDVAPFLRGRGFVFLSVSAQYGQKRISNLAVDVPGYRNLGVIESTSLTPFDLKRADLMEALSTYVAEEKRTGTPYEFREASGGLLSAAEALDLYTRTGDSPLTRWQVALFQRTE